MADIVVDASAVLAVIQAERGGDVAARQMKAAHISTVNLAEVVAKLVDRGIDDVEIDLALSALGLRSIPFDEAQAREAGFLRRFTRHLGLSLGDRACLAAAKLKGSPVLTGDRCWSELKVGIEVRQIR